MWFLFALLTAFAWGATSFFYKKSSAPDDSTSHLKIVIMIGLVMGIHAIAYIIWTGHVYDPWNMIVYFPISFLYIVAMVFSFIGFRYIDLSIAAPIQHSSGAITAILLLIFYPSPLSVLEIGGIVIITLGVILLARYEKEEDEPKLPAPTKDPTIKKKMGVLALAFPLLYAFIDGTGAFLDGVYLEKKQILSEADALLSYEFSFFLFAVVIYAYLTWVKKERFNPLTQRNLMIGASLETAGQFCYVYAMAGNATISAPLIASSGLFSILLSRVFLKEVLSKEQYVLIGVIMVGIIAIGLA